CAGGEGLRTSAVARAASSHRGNGGCSCDSGNSTPSPEATAAGATHPLPRTVGGQPCTALGILASVAVLRARGRHVRVVRDQVSRPSASNGGEPVAAQWRLHRR